MPQEIPKSWNLALGYSKNNHFLSAFQQLSRSSDLEKVQFGLWLLSQQLNQQALKWFELLEKKGNREPQLSHYIGICALQLGQLEKPEAYFKRSLLVPQPSQQSFIIFAQYLREANRFQEAKNALDQMLNIYNQDSDLLIQSGIFFMEAQQYQLSLGYLKKAEERSPQNSMLMNDLANCYQYLGEFDCSHQYFKKAVQLNPNLDGAYVGLASSKKFHNLQDISSEQLILKQLSLTTRAEAKSCAHFALGKIADDKQNFEMAWSAYQIANNLQTEIQGKWDAQKWNHNIDLIMQHFASSQNIEHYSHPSLVKPIFIIGMPRSGTTLLERELCRLESVETAGELDCIDRILAQCSNKESPDIFYSPKLELSVNLAQYRHYYHQQLLRNCQKAKTTTRWIIDKNPLNFVHVGLIQRLFPDALFIHSQRNPLDILVSCYFQHFAHPNMKFSYNLENIVEFIYQYQNLMSFWKSNTQYQIIDVDYEQIVVNTLDKLNEIALILKEPRLQQLVDAKNGANEEHFVRTASIWQAKQPIYQKSIHRWRHYQTQLASVPYQKLQPGLSDGL